MQGQVGKEEEGGEEGGGVRWRELAERTGTWEGKP